LQRRTVTASRTQSDHPRLMFEGKTRAQRN
jgi:hypothetical protein